MENFVLFNEKIGNYFDYIRKKLRDYTKNVRSRIGKYVKNAFVQFKRNRKLHITIIFRTKWFIGVSSQASVDLFGR